MSSEVHSCRRVGTMKYVWQLTFQAGNIGRITKSQTLPVS
jgi:hypothetical protein